MVLIFNDKRRGQSKTPSEDYSYKYDKSGENA